MATRAITPKASSAGFPPLAPEAPRVNERIKVLVIGPLATPPESKAIPVKSLGQIKERISVVLRYLEHSFTFIKNYFRFISINCVLK